MKSKLNTLVLLITLSVFGISFQVNAHSETVANLSIEHAEDGLTIIAALEKRHLTYALKKEAKCSPKDMLRVCANKYVAENIKVSINGKSVILTKVSQELTKNNVVITYKVKFEETIKNIVIKSDYMIKYNDHSKVKIVSKLTSENLLYSLSATRKKITITI